MSTDESNFNITTNKYWRTRWPEFNPINRSVYWLFRTEMLNKLVMGRWTQQLVVWKWTSVWEAWLHRWMGCFRGCNGRTSVKLFKKRLSAWREHLQRELIGSTCKREEMWNYMYVHLSRTDEFGKYCNKKRNRFLYCKAWDSKSNELLRKGYYGRHEMWNYMNRDMHWKD